MMMGVKKPAMKAIQQLQKKFKNNLFAVAQKTI
jgi:hypothetical protein